MRKLNHHLSKPSSLPASGSQGQRGASLIEVLVSIVIASIGLLALAGVNAASLRYTKMSQYRATATQLANGIGERMRANKGVSATPGPATGFYAGNPYDMTDSFAAQATPPTKPDDVQCVAGDCNAAEIAALDLARWRLLVRDQLPEGSAFLKRPPALPSASSQPMAMDVWVVWRDPAVASKADAPALESECPKSLARKSDLSIRCSYFRINL